VGFEAVNIFTGEVVEIDLPVYSQVYIPVPDLSETSVAEDTKTEQGYIPPEAQIRDQVRAGLMVAASRRARFDSDLYPEGTLDLDIALDPYRDQGSDIIDLARQASLVGARLREQDVAAKKAQAEADKAAAEKARSELSASLVGKTAQEIDALLRTSKAGL
jgi:hypothetical protein